MGEEVGLELVEEVIGFELGGVYMGKMRELGLRRMQRMQKNFFCIRFYFT